MIQLDVQTGFLHSEVKGEVCVKQPVGFEKLDLSGQPYVRKLKKSLYGLKQSPATGTELSNMNLSPKDSWLACATHVFTSRMTARLKLSLIHI